MIVSVTSLGEQKDFIDLIEYITRSVSILYEDYTNIIDEGDGDKIAKILEDHANKVKRVPNILSRNHGITVIQGEFKR